MHYILENIDGNKWHILNLRTDTDETILYLRTDTDERKSIILYLRTDTDERKSIIKTLEQIKLNKSTVSYLKTAKYKLTILYLRFQTPEIKSPVLLGL